MLRERKVFVLIFALIIFGLGMVMVGLGKQEAGMAPIEQIETTKEATKSAQIIPIDGQVVKVIRVIDGDTIEIESGQKVRFLGVDTPETVDPRRPVACFGKEASGENKKLVEGKDIILVKDISETDKFGRLLRYVYVKMDDGNILFINDHLLRQGFAKTSTYPPDVKFTEQFVQAEREAREKSKGLWQKCPNP